MGTHKGSRTDRLRGMNVGDRIYVETTLADYATAMRGFGSVRSRRPEWMRDWEIETCLFTAVGSSAGDIRYLICVERVV